MPAEDENFSGLSGLDQATGPLPRHIHAPGEAGDKLREAEQAPLDPS